MKKKPTKKKTPKLKKDGTIDKRCNNSAPKMDKNNPDGRINNKGDKKKLDEQLIFDLAIIGCTIPEIASITHVAIDTISANYKHIVDSGHSQMKESLRRKQYNLAVKDNGNVPMLIHLGKTILKQSEKLEIDHTGNIDHTVTVVFVDSDTKPEEDS